MFVNSVAGLTDLGKFLGFMASTYGMLAGITLFFPLFNQFIEIVPIGYSKFVFNGSSDGPSRDFPFLNVTLTTIILVFYIFYIFTDLEGIKALEAKKLRSIAFRSFIIWFFSYFIYLFVYVSLIQHDILNFVQSPGDLVYKYYYIFFNFFMLFLYILIFFSITRAFLYLGLIEFLKKEHVLAA